VSRCAVIRPYVRLTVRVVPVIQATLSRSSGQLSSRRCGQYRLCVTESDAFLRAFDEGHLAACDYVAGLSFVAPTTGKRKESDALLKKVAANQKASKAVQRVITDSGIEITVYTQTCQKNDSAVRTV
jgi:hypothetical protein